MEAFLELSLPVNPSPQRLTAYQFILGINRWSSDSMLSIRDKNCVYQMLPQSLGRSPMTNSEWATGFQQTLPIFRDFKVTVHDLIEDVEAKKIVMWASSTASTDVGPFKNEYMFVLHFNEEGDKVTKFLEFVDSKLSTVFMSKLQEFTAGNAEKGSEVA